MFPSFCRHRGAAPRTCATAASWFSPDPQRSPPAAAAPPWRALSVLTRHANRLQHRPTAAKAEAGGPLRGRLPGGSSGPAGAGTTAQG